MRDLLEAQNIFDWIETNAPHLITEEAERVQGTIQDRLSVLASEAKSSYASDIQGYIMDAIFPEGTEYLDESQLAVWENIATGLQEQVFSTIDQIISGELSGEELQAAIDSLSMDSMLEEADLIGDNVDVLMGALQEETEGFAKIEEIINKRNYDPQTVLDDLLAQQAAWDEAVKSVLGEDADVPSGYEGRIEQMREEVNAINGLYENLDDMFTGAIANATSEKLKEAGYRTMWQLQTIYDNLAELYNGDAEDYILADSILVKLLDGTAIQEALSGGQTLDQYIASVFSGAGVELEKATAEFAEYANSALETMLEVAPDKALEKTNLEDILTNMLGGESLYDIVNEMAKEQLSSLGEEYVTDENIASVGGAILEALFGDTPEILSLIDANTG